MLFRSLCTLKVKLVQLISLTVSLIDLIILLLICSINLIKAKKVKFDLPDPISVEGLDVQGERFFSVHDDVTALERLIEEREDGHEGRLLTG